jgi:hypothetical protein
MAGQIFCFPPNGVGSVNGTSSYTEIKIVFEGEVTDNFSFAFISPEGANNN